MAGFLRPFQSGDIATLLASNLPFTDQDIAKMKNIAAEMDFTMLVTPGEAIAEPALRNIAATRTLEEMAARASCCDASRHRTGRKRFRLLSDIRHIAVFLQWRSYAASVPPGPPESTGCEPAGDYLPVRVHAGGRRPGHLHHRHTRQALVETASGSRAAPAGGIVYFIAIGTGFMFVEMAMMQQLSIFLGHPIYAMVVVLGGLDSVGGTGQPGLGTEQPELSAPSWRFSYRWLPRSGPAC